MMRRGTLAEHDVASVLRQAAQERLSGQIDVDGDRPAVIYLADGELSLVCWADDEVAIAVDDDADDATYSAAILTEERRLRAASRDVLGLILDRDEGWYHHHPLGEHRAAALWSWPVEEVLAEVAVRARRPSSTSPRAAGDDASNGRGDARPDGPSRDGAPPASALPPPIALRASAEEIAARRPTLHLADGRAPRPTEAPRLPAGSGRGPEPPAPDVPPATVASDPAGPSDPTGGPRRDAPDAASPAPGPDATSAPAPSAATGPAVPDPTTRAEPSADDASPNGASADPSPAEAGPTWGLAPTPPTEPLDEAAWSVVVALAGRATEAEIVERLGWPAVRAEIVLRALEARGVVVASGHPAPVPTA